MDYEFCYVIMLAHMDQGYQLRLYHQQTKALLQALHDKIIKTLQMLLYFRLNNSLSQPYLASSEQVPYWHSGDLIVSIEGYLCYNMLS